MRLSKNLSKAISDPSNAPRLLVGTGEDKTHLCVVMTADRDSMEDLIQTYVN